ADTVPTMEAYTNMATKVSRTMAAHVDTLAKLRSGGKQTHEVRYVYVSGPAVIGDHNQAVLGSPSTPAQRQKLAQCHAPDAIAGPAAPPSLPLRSEDEARDRVPLASGEGPEEMPDARGEKPRRADGQGERPIRERA